MAKKQRNEIAVGLTVLVSLALAIYIVIVLGDWSNLIAEKQRIPVELPYHVGLKGLAKGSPILIGGAKVGTVAETHIRTNPSPAPGEDPIEVGFTMELPKEYVLRDDCLLAPESGVLGGQAMLVIKDLGAKGKILDGSSPVELKMERGISEAIDSIKSELNAENPDSMLAQLKGTMQQLTAIVGRLKTQMDPEDQKALLAKVHVGLDRLNHSLAELDDLIATNKPTVTQAVTSVKNAAGTLEEELPEIVNRIKPALDQANEAMAEAKASMTNLKEFTGNGRDMLVVNRESIDNVIRNIGEVSVNLKMASREIRRAPWRLIYQPKKDELHVQAVADAAGDFATGAERLDDTSMRLKALLEAAKTSLTVDKKRIDDLLAELENSFSEFQKAEDKLWEELK